MSSWGNSGPGGCGRTVLHLAAGLAFWVAVFCGLVIAMGCMPVADNPPDANTTNPCAELDAPPEGCE